MRWWKERGYTPPERDAFGILERIIAYRFDSKPASLVGSVVQCDARQARSHFAEHVGRVKLVVTSPPYLDVTNYSEDQWLRLWFLGGPDSPF
ncbi:MAG: DNA methylase, partial [Actinobacteria bacterium]|nr:DNA methylase [Actinomycetota bacterium]